MIDLKCHLRFFLQKDRNFIRKFLGKNNISYDVFPEEQRKAGFDIIETPGIEFWFDCSNKVYMLNIDFSCHENNQIFTLFGGLKLKDQEVVSAFLAFLEETGTKFSEYEYQDANRSLQVIVFELKDKVMVFVTLYKDIVSGITIKYDGYSTFEYKEGISLEEFLNGYKKPVT